MPFAKPFISPFCDLRRAWPESAWLELVCDSADETLKNHPHGDLPRWQQALQALPAVEPAMEASGGVAVLGAHAANQATLAETLMVLHPWRKGPLQLGGCFIDTEWRSDWKWQRLAPHLQLSGARVLDIGCGNGYFGWRMLAAGARLVVGVDPTLLFVMQWLACRHFAGQQDNYVLPLGIEDLPLSAKDPAAGFDVVCSMGVLYHRRDPLEHLQQIRHLLRPGGEMVLETLVLPPGHEPDLLVPEQRYARMRNVWALPGPGRLEAWVSEAGFRDVRLVDITPTSLDEQRSTEWMKFESLAESLDAKNPQRTLEGYPAPTRAIVLARC